MLSRYNTIFDAHFNLVNNKIIKLNQRNKIEVQNLLSKDEAVTDVREENNHSAKIFMSFVR